MANRYIRIVGRCGDYMDYPLYIDAPIDEAGTIITKAWLFGFMGKTLGENLNPFIGRMDKDEPSRWYPFLLDFGTDFADRDRYYWTNLVLKKVRKGEQFTIRMRSDEDPSGFVDYIYEIRELIDLARQEQLDKI